jgi:hypothetical protein
MLRSCPDSEKGGDQIPRLFIQIAPTLMCSLLCAPLRTGNVGRGVAIGFVTNRITEHVIGVIAVAQIRLEFKIKWRIGCPYNKWVFKIRIAFGGTSKNLGRFEEPNSDCAPGVIFETDLMQLLTSAPKMDYGGIDINSAPAR